MGMGGIVAAIVHGTAKVRATNTRVCVIAQVRRTAAGVRTLNRGVGNLVFHQLRTEFCAEGERSHNALVGVIVLPGEDRLGPLDGNGNGCILSREHVIL